MLPQPNQPQTPNEGNSEALFSLGKYHYEKYSLLYEMEYFYTAKKYLEILAEQNNADAQFLLGMLYKTKEGSHSKEAIHWFLQAEQNGVKDATDELNQFHYIKEKAENGCPESLFQLGEYYEFQGFYADAAELWEKAAHQGCVLAQNKLYDFHKSNHNYVESEYWEAKLAQNEKDRQIELGVLHLQLENYKEAIYYLKKIAVGEGEYGEYPYQSYDDYIEEWLYGCHRETLQEAIYWLGRIAKINENIKSYLIKLDEKFISLLYTEKHIFWLEKLAKKGSITAHEYLMHLYYEQGLFDPASHWYGKSSETGNEQEIKIIWKIYNSPFKYNSLFSDTISYWEEKLAERGYAEAQCEVASKHLYEGDYEKAIEWYEKSAKQGYYKAQSKLGLLLYEGTEDHNEAIYWLNQAELQKKDYDEDGNLPLQANPKSFKNLTQESWKIVLHWYKVATEKGDYLGQLHLGICYNEGLGTDKDLDKALFWLKKSLEHECIETFRYLEETKILKIGNPYYEQFRKVEDAQPLKREFMQEWISVNQELFNTLDNPDFEEQFKAFSSSVDNQVSYIFYQFYRTFQGLLKAPEVFRDSLNEYRSIMQGKRLISYNDCCGKNYLIPENLEELFEWVIKNQNQPKYFDWVLYKCGYQGYDYGIIEFYEPDFQELFDFDQIHNSYLYTDEFKAYCENRKENSF